MLNMPQKPTNQPTIKKSILRVQTLDEAICSYICANTHEKSKNSSLHPNLLPVDK